MGAKFLTSHLVFQNKANPHMRSLDPLFWTYNYCTENDSVIIILATATTNRPSAWRNAAGK